MQRFKYYFLLFLVGIAVLSWWAVWEKKEQGQFRVIFFDVGQGDSIFIEDELGHQILIDGGEDKAVLENLGQVLPFYDRSLDLVILTHPHNDHVAGLVEVLQRYQVDRVLYSGVRYDNAAYQEFKEVIKTKGISFAYPHYGQRIILAGDAYLDILNPWEEIVEQDLENLNNSSIVCRLVKGDQEYLFTGDAETKLEKELIQKNIYLQANILKLGHHGSQTSSSESFLRAVDPREAIISVGENKYGHPHALILERLHDFDIEIKRTDLLGDINY